ncbi:MAG: hypothetical protein A2Z25_22845 [Planctomycetes bacterium RBG_16_55_9]|nr:MAG: hypothetical protein A2Z25_22845 [Planctomycetes bacterium RBG_16_55_9]
MHMETPSDNDEIMVKNYVVACVDVLGQEERLRGFPLLIHNMSPEDKDGLTKAIKETYGKVSMVRRLFKQFLKDDEQPPENHSWYQSFPEEQKFEFQKIS